MSVILGGIVGVLIGITLFSVVSVSEINKMQDKSYDYKKKYLAEKLKVNQRDELLKKYEEDQVILLDNAHEYRTIKKNFIDDINRVLYSNVHNDNQKTNKIKELVSDFDSQN